MTRYCRLQVERATSLICVPPRSHRLQEEKGPEAAEPGSRLPLSPKDMVVRMQEIMTLED